MHLKGTHLLKYLSCLQTFRELHHSEWGQVHPMLSNRILPAGTWPLCLAALARKFSSSVSLSTQLSDVTAHCPPCVAQSIATLQCLACCILSFDESIFSRMQGAGARPIATCCSHVWRKLLCSEGDPRGSPVVSVSITEKGL